MGLTNHSLVGWSAYWLAVCTNYDVESWPYRLNQKARKRHLNLYLLVRLLQKEAECVDLQVKLVSDGKLTRRQKKKYVQVHAKLNHVWNEYEQGTKTAGQLLKACAYIYGPIWIQLCYCMCMFVNLNFYCYVDYTRTINWWNESLVFQPSSLDNYNLRFYNYCLHNNMYTFIQCCTIKSFENHYTSNFIVTVSRSDLTFCHFVVYRPT